MCIQATPAGLNSVYEIKTAAIMTLVQRFTLAGGAAERKIIIAGMLIETNTAKRNPCVVSNTNTLPFRISYNIPGMYKWNNQHRCR